MEAETAELRKAMGEIEKPVRDKATAKERQRFPEEYVSLLDIPSENRTPLQKQLALLVERQVYTRNKVTSAQMKPADREKWEGMSKRMSEFDKDRPPAPPTAMGMSDVGLVCPPTHLLNAAVGETRRRKNSRRGFFRHRRSRRENDTDRDHHRPPRRSRGVDRVEATTADGARDR